MMEKRMENIEDEENYYYYWILLHTFFFLALYFLQELFYGFPFRLMVLASPAFSYRFSLHFGSLLNDLVFAIES